MIVNEKERWLYLGPPKTASTTMHIELVKPPWNGVQVDPDAQHDIEVPERYRGFFVFGTVRDPYERAMSLYWHYLRDMRRVRAKLDGIEDPVQIARLPFPIVEMPLQEFLLRVLTKNLTYARVLDSPFYCNNLCTWYRWVTLDAFIKIERLEEGFEMLPFVNGRQVFFDYHNAPGRGLWRDQRTPRTVDLIHEWAGNDFKRYGYATQSAKTQSFR